MGAKIAKVFFRSFKINLMGFFRCFEESKPNNFAVIADGCTPWVRVLKVLILNIQQHSRVLFRVCQPCQ